MNSVSIRLLLIDDDLRLGELLRGYLEPQGVALEQADSGEAGLGVAAGGFDAVLLDVMMPGIDGLETLRRLRARHTMPVIMLTARGDEADRVVGLELGADDYVAKPFSPRELVARVRTVLRRATKPAAAPVAVVAAAEPALPIAVDDGRRQIRFYGQLLELSRYEYGLLKTLVSRPGHVFSRDTLLERVWDDATESLDRTVDAHVKTLRAKMKGVAPTLEPIKTHRGTGYALAEDLPATKPES
jgi:two-component system catabolic regulation response regulator CreB